MLKRNVVRKGCDTIQCPGFHLIGLSGAQWEMRLEQCGERGVEEKPGVQHGRREALGDLRVSVWAIVGDRLPVWMGEQCLDDDSPGR